MLRIRFILLFLLTVSLADRAAAQGRHPWLTDFADAQKRAVETGRPMLINFTGSDWSVPCQRLEAEVFTTPYMVRYADRSLISVLVDFPRTRELPPALAAQNRLLAEAFEVTTHPTIWIMMPDGQRLGPLGYMEGGPKTFVRAIERLIRDAPPAMPVDITVE